MIVVNITRSKGIVWCTFDAVGGYFVKGEFEKDDSKKTKGLFSEINKSIDAARSAPST